MSKAVSNCQADKELCLDGRAVDADRPRLIAATLSHFGRLDALVNNAGVLQVSLPLEVTDEHWDLVMAVNAKAVYFCCQLALRHMIDQHSGRIVNLASIAGKTASTPYHPIYNVSKAAVLAMTKTLALACASHGVRVNAVCPGVIETPMQERVDREFAAITGQQPQAIRAERVGRIPIGYAPHMAAMDIAELNPLYDTRAQATTLIAARLLLDFITTRVRQAQ